MLNRLANVIYWAGCLAAGLFGLFIVVGLVRKMLGYTTDWEILAYAVALALGAWVSGRAVRYVLSGR
jgi:uncharacterized membrane protein YuzA (DUF378 family)